MNNLIDVDEQTFISNVNELVTAVQTTLQEACKTKKYLGAEIYVAMKRLLLAYAQALGPDNVKLIEKNVLIISPDDYKEAN